MSNINYRRHGFPPKIIQHAAWLYFRFPLSYRNVEDLLARVKEDTTGVFLPPRRNPARKQDP